MNWSTYFSSKLDIEDKILYQKDKQMLFQFYDDNCSSFGKHNYA